MANNSYFFQIPSEQEIQKLLENKTFGPSDIKWVKNVNDGDEMGPNYKSAYLINDFRLIHREDGLYFCLQVNNKDRHGNPYNHNLNALRNVQIGDIILLYQWLISDQKNRNNKPIEAKCFTHLVTPIADEIVYNPYSADPPDWPGKLVKVIAMSRDTVVGSIQYDTDKIGWRTVGFAGYYQNLGWPNGAPYKITDQLNDTELSSLQNNICKQFKWFRWKWNDLDKKWKMPEKGDTTGTVYFN